MITSFLIRTVTVFGGIAVSKALNKVLPINTAAFQGDPVGTIGATIIQAAAADAIMGYIETRIIETLDSIAPAGITEEQPPAA